MNTDRAALAALYNATNGSSWQDDTTWLSNWPLGEWHGVSTDADGRVADLRLDGKQLSGSILAELGNLYNLEIWPESPLAGFRTTLIRRSTVV